MRIQSLRFMVQPGSYSKIVSALLWARLGYIIAPTLPLNIVLVIPKQTLLSPNTMTLPLWKETSPHLQILPEITKGSKQVIKILMIFNGRVSTALWLPIQLILLILDELFPFALPLNMNQYIKTIMAQLLLITWTHILSTLTVMIPPLFCIPLTKFL